MREISKLVALAGGIAFAATLAHAANQTILGKSLTVKDPTAGVDPKKRSIKGSAKAAKGSSDTLVGDPTLAGSAGGALLDIFANGTHSTAQEFVLKQGTTLTGKPKPFWSVIGATDNPTGYRYEDAKGDNQTPVKSVLIRKSANGAISIKVKLSGKNGNGTINVVPPNPGISGCMALKLGQSAGAGDRYSVQFGVESKIKNVDGKLFSAKKPGNEGICPLVVATTSTTTTTVATSSSTTSTHASTTTTTTLYGSPSRAFLEKVEGLLD